MKHLLRRLRSKFVNFVVGPLIRPGYFRCEHGIRKAYYYGHNREEVILQYWTDFGAMPEHCWYVNPWDTIPGPIENNLSRVATLQEAVQEMLKRDPSLGKAYAFRIIYPTMV